MSHTRGALVLVVSSLLIAGPAAGDPGAEKERVDSRIDQLAEQATTKDRQAGVLTEELSAAQGRVRELDGAVSAQQARLDELDAQLADARARVGELDRTIQAQTKKLAIARRTYRASVKRLEARVHDLYIAGDPDLLAVVFGTESFVDLLDHVELFRRIGRQDRRIVTQVAATRNAIADARRKTQAARVEVAELAQAIGDRAAEQRDVVSRLAASRDALQSAQAERRQTLDSIRSDREELLAEIEQLEKQSAALAETIRASQSIAPSSGATTAVAGSGVLRWPVSGPVTSGFGMRWGRMHEGIDIAVPSGTAVGAAGPGTIIYAGWLGGYGNLVVVDHGNGLSTAYAHNTSFAAGVGQTVETGTIVAYSGSTGNSSGPHVHFEVRVNGSAVDPLGYL